MFIGKYPLPISSQAENDLLVSRINPGFGNPTANTDDPLV